jgi:hypothetical protein
VERDSEGPAPELWVGASRAAAARAASTESHTLTAAPRRRGSGFGGRRVLSFELGSIRRRLPGVPPREPGLAASRCQGLMSCCSVWKGA